MDALNWCKERLLVAGAPLTASLLFAPREERDKILALRCVASEIAAASAGSDSTLAGARLAWWRQALAEGNNSHPALQALVNSDADQHLQPADFDPLIAAVADAVEPPRFERFDALWAFCCQLGGSVSVLEFKLLQGGKAGLEAFQTLGGAHYLVRVVRDLVVDARANRWLVPLDFQADYQVSRQDALAKEPSRPFAGLVRALLSEAVKRGEVAVSGLSAEHRRRQVHLLAEWALDRRLAGAIDRRPQRLFQGRVAPGHWGNVWTAWRAARRALKA